MRIPYRGSHVDLMEVIAMARDGRIHAETTEFPRTEAVGVHGKLKQGDHRSRRAGTSVAATAPSPWANQSK